MSLKCYYHPDREATTKCEKCEKMLCIECKKQNSVTHGAGESQYATQHEFCMPCYCDNEMEKYAPPGRRAQIALIILPIIDLIFIILFFNYGFGLIAPSLFFGVLSLAAVISYFKKRKISPVKLAELKAKKENFFKILQSGGFCPECGNKVETGIAICPSCGYDIAG